MSCRKWEGQIVKWHEGELDQEAEARLLHHLEICAHCRTRSEKFLQIDRFLLGSPEPPHPLFLNEKIASRVIEEMRQDSLKSRFRHFIGFFAYFRPALVGISLVVGIGLGILTGLNVSHSIITNSPARPYDVLAWAGIGDGGGDPSLDALWLDIQGDLR